MAAFAGILRGRMPGNTEDADAGSIVEFNIKHLLCQHTPLPQSSMEGCQSYLKSVFTGLPVILLDGTRVDAQRRDLCGIHISNGIALYLIRDCSVSD